MGRKDSVDGHQSRSGLSTKETGNENHFSSSYLLPRRDEDQGWFLGRVLQDSVVDWFRHGEKTRCRVRDVQPLDVKLQWNRADVRVEVERCVCRAAEPALVQEQQSKVR